MLVLAHPMWLWALPLTLVMLFQGPAARTGAAIALIHPSLGSFSTSERRAASGRLTAYCNFAAACFILLSLAQPQWQGAPVAEQPLGRDIVLLVDASSSMSITDFTAHGQAVSRLDVLKDVAGRFVQARSGDHFGLIVFGDHAATLAPPSFDEDLILGQLSRLQIGIAGEATALGDALGLALKQVKSESGLRPVIILFSDGDSTAGQMKVAEALAAAQALGVHIFTVAIGTDLFASPTRPVPANPDPSLRQLAQTTGGKFYLAGDTHALENVVQDIGRLAPNIARRATRRATVEWYGLPLFAAIILLLVAQTVSAVDTRFGRAGGASA